MPSTSMTKVKMSPPLLAEKSCQMPFSGETMKLGVLSTPQGEWPFKLRPARFSSMYWLMTSSTARRDLISSLASIVIL